MKAKVINNNGRDKAFIGAIVGAVTGIAGGIISAKKKKKAEQLAFEQEQAEQTRKDGIAQMQSLNSTYANQDYVDQYKQKVTLKNGGKVKMDGKYSDRVATASSNKHTGRKKKAFGSVISSIGKDFSKENIAGTIQGIGKGVTNAIVPTNNLNQNITNGITSISNAVTARNNEIAQNALNAKLVKKMGGRKKAMAGIGDAAGGIGSLVGALTTKVSAPKMIKKSDGFSFGAPKTGLVQNSYQVDANGNPIPVVDNPIITPNSNGLYEDRLTTAKMGAKKKIKS